MSIENLRSLIPTVETDIIGVFTKDFTQVFARARPLKVSVKEESKLMEQPLETGANTVDHRIIQPVEIELSMILQAEDYRDTYDDIKQFYLDGTLLSVLTQTASYDSLMIESMPHEEGGEMYDAITLALKLKEVHFVTPEFGIVPRSPKDSSTVDRGNQQSKEVNQSVLSRGIFGRQAA